MRSPQHQTNIQTQSRHSQTETENLQPDILPPINPLLAQLGSVPNPTAHAALLQRSPANPQAILQLQRQYGNRYVNRVLQQSQSSRSMPIQAKMMLGAVGNKYEQEADRISKQVVNQINIPATQSSTQSQSVQRQEMPEEDDELMMMKPVAGKIQRQEMLEEDDELMMKSESVSVQRMEIPEEDDEAQMKPMVQRLASEDSGAIAPDLETSIQQARGSGHPLAENIRKPMEQAFGVDFSRVKVHTDVQSDSINQAIQAKAFTTGQDIFFQQGAYNPGNRDGQELLAHELTHVVQQRGTVDNSAEMRTRVNQSPTDRIQRRTVNIVGVKIGRTRIYSQAGQVVGRVGRNTKIEVDDNVLPQAVHTVNGNKTLHKILPISASRIDLKDNVDPDNLWISGTRFVNTNAPVGGGHEMDTQMGIKNTDTIAKRLGAILETYRPRLEHDISLMNNPPTLDNYKNLLIDLTAQEIQGALDVDPQVLNAYLQDTLSYTACYDAAARLLTLLGVNNPGLEQNGGALAINGVNNLKNEVNTLRDAMQNSQDTGTPTVFRIEFAKHGFVLVVRQNRVEHLQGFANESDVLESIEAERIYTLDKAKQYLRAMASTNPDNRDWGAGKMGWNAEPIGIIDQYDNVVDPIQFRWWSKPLATMQELTNRVALQIEANRREIIAAVPALNSPLPVEHEE